MEPNFVEGRSDNLPAINPFMISVFFMENMNYLSAEIKGMKNVRASRSEYGDQAVGFVQIKRDANICIVKGQITPEHKVRGKPYGVIVKIDEANDKILSSQCCDCTASSGGCKHSIAFLYWLLRKSEEPSPTSVECYWKKAVLSKVGSSIKLMKASSLRTGEANEDFCEKQGFLNNVIEEGKKRNCGGNLVKYFLPPVPAKALSLRYLSAKYCHVWGFQTETLRGKISTEFLF